VFAACQRTNGKVVGRELDLNPLRRLETAVVQTLRQVPLSSQLRCIMNSCVELKKKRYGKASVIKGDDTLNGKWGQSPAEGAQQEQWTIICIVIVFVLSFELSILASKISHSTLPVLNSAYLTTKRQQSQKQPSQQRNQSQRPP